MGGGAGGRGLTRQLRSLECDPEKEKPPWFGGKVVTKSVGKALWLRGKPETGHEPHWKRTSVWSSKPQSKVKKTVLSRQLIRSTAGPPCLLSPTALGQLSPHEVTSELAPLAVCLSPEVGTCYV
jgi:hypothetical protein